MNLPDEHETAAFNFMSRDDNPTAMVYAVLALASAVSRLAEAHESIAADVHDMKPTAAVKATFRQRT